MNERANGQPAGLGVHEGQQIPRVLRQQPSICHLPFHLSLERAKERCVISSMKTRKLLLAVFCFWKSDQSGVKCTFTQPSLSTGIWGAVAEADGGGEGGEGHVVMNKTSQNTLAK